MDAWNRTWRGFTEWPAPNERLLFPGLLMLLLPLAAVLLSRAAPGDPAPPGPARPFDPRGRNLLPWLDGISVVAGTLALFAASPTGIHVRLGGKEVFRATESPRALALFAVALFARWWIAYPKALPFVRGRNLPESLRLLRRPEAILVGGVWAVLGFFGSLGLNFPFHRVLFETVFLFRSIRAPARWAMVAYLGLAVLAGAGAQALADAWRRRRSGTRAAALVFALAGLGLLFEDRAAPLELIRGEADPDEATLFLAKTPMKGGLVELPAGTEDHGNYRAMLRAADHGKPLVTAVSGFSSPIVSRIEEDERKTPIPDELLDFLEKIPTSYILVRDSWLSPETARPAPRVARAGDGLGTAAVREALRRPHEERPLRGRQERAGGESARPAAVDAGRRAPAFPRALPRGPDPPRLDRRARRGRRRDRPAHGARLGPHERRGPSRHRHDRRRGAQAREGRARAAPGRSGRLPSLGDCRSAGYEATYAFEAGDEGPHEIAGALSGRRRPAAPLPAAEIHLEAVKRAAKDAGVLLVFVALTVVMTWPWAAHVRDTSFDPGDSYLNAWTLAWDFHQTFHDPLHLFDSNNFFPYRYTLALSEHQWGIALLFFPAFAAGLAPLTVHGLAMLFGFAFSGYGAFRLARTLTGSTPAAWVAGRRVRVRAVPVPPPRSPLLRLRGLDAAPRRGRRPLRAPAHVAARRLARRSPSS